MREVWSRVTLTFACTSGSDSESVSLVSADSINLVGSFVFFCVIHSGYSREMGSKASLMLQDSEIEEIQKETGCKLFCLGSERLLLGYHHQADNHWIRLSGYGRILGNGYWWYGYLLVVTIQVYCMGWMNDIELSADCCVLHQSP